VKFFVLIPTPVQISAIIQYFYLKMNNPEAYSKFVPKQAITPTPELYDELVVDCMEKLATVSLAQTPGILSHAVIHDNGCGTGAAIAAIMESVSSSSTEISIKATDINDNALAIYQKSAIDKDWPADGIRMDSTSLSFSDDTFTHSIGNALLFVLPNDGIDALKEMYRTLKPGGIAIVNSWAYIPNMVPIQVIKAFCRCWTNLFTNII